MKMTCTQENFRKAIGNSERIVSKQNTLPILNNLLFEAEKGFLKISATNLEIGIEIKIGAKIEKEGRIAVPAKLIGNLVSNLIGDENINLELVEQNLKIMNGTTKAMIKILLADDFPLIPQKNNEFIVGMPVAKLRDVFLKINTSVSHNEIRQELTGFNLIFGQEQIFFSSTDGFRLSEYIVNLSEITINKPIYDEFSEKGMNIIVPANTLVELNRIIQNNHDEDVINFIIEDGQIFFEFENIKIVSRLINGKYPEYKHIMPQSYKTIILGEKKTFQNALKLAGVFVNMKSNEIGLKIDSKENKVVVSTKSAEVGENSTEVDFEIQGESQEINFNLKYLSDGINIINSEYLALLSNNDSSPVALREVDGKTKKIREDFTYIVMPIKN